MTKTQLTDEVKRLADTCSELTETLAKVTLAAKKKEGDHKSELSIQAGEVDQLRAVASRLELTIQGDIDQLAEQTEKLRGYRQECTFAHQRLVAESNEHQILRTEVDKAWRESGGAVAREHRLQVADLTAQLMEERRESFRNLELARKIGELALILPRVATQITTDGQVEA